MNKRKSVEGIGPRKEPKQERSRQTYQVILNGAISIIRRDGIDKLSTNRVAEESGVSIGSLYQYFPSKEAIVAALIDQTLEQEFNGVRTLLESGSANMGAREIAKSFFLLYYREEEDYLKLRRALIAAVPNVERSARTLKFHSEVADFVIGFFQHHFEVPLTDVKSPAFILQYLLKGIALSSVDEQVANLCRESLAEDLAEVFLNLLRIPESARGARS